MKNLGDLRQGLTVTYALAKANALCSPHSPCPALTAQPLPCAHRTAPALRSSHSPCVFVGRRALVSFAGTHPPIRTDRPIGGLTVLVPV